MQCVPAKTTKYENIVSVTKDSSALRASINVAVLTLPNFWIAYL